MSETSIIRLSQITKCAELAAFFQRGERDSGAAFAVPATPKPDLAGGAAAKVPEYV